MYILQIFTALRTACVRRKLVFWMSEYAWAKWGFNTFDPFKVYKCGIPWSFRGGCDFSKHILTPYEPHIVTAFHVLWGGTPSPKFFRLGFWGLGFSKKFQITRSLQASEFESFVYFMVTPAREHILYHKESFHPERYEVSFHRESHRLGEPSSKIYATLAAKEVGFTFLMTYRCWPTSSRTRIWNIQTAAWPLLHGREN